MKEPSLESMAARVDAMDKAIQLLQDFADRSPTTKDVSAEVKALKELTEVTFKGNQTALDAALKTQKEASDKIEANFTKGIDNMQELMRAGFKASDDKIDDLRTRVTSNEGRTKGIGDSWGYIIGALGALATIASIISFIIRNNS